MSRQSIQKIKSNAIVYWVWYLVCRHCWYEDQSMQCIECYVCWHCWHWCLWHLHNTVYKVMRCETCTLLCLKWPLTPAKREGYFKSLLSCWLSCSPVQGGSFVKRSLSCINSINIYTQYLMVWLKSPQSQLSKTFCRLKIGWILRKLWTGMCRCVLHQQCWHR